jgi:WD40 repeat protein
MGQEIRKGGNIMRGNKIEMSISVAVCLGMFLVSSLIINAGRNEGRTPYVYSLDSRGLQRLDTERNERKVIFDTSGLYQVSFSISPCETVIAVLVTERGVVPPGAHDYSTPPKNSLIFISPEGKQIAKLDEDVRKYAWSPDGDKISYITGTYYEGGVGFKTTGVYFFDLKDRSKKQINKDFPHPTMKDYEGGGYGINWAVHDSNIYIQEFEYLGGNYRYNTKTGKTEKVPYKGIHFSPDGKYYLALSSMEYPRVYMSSTNEEITERVKSRLGDVPWNWIEDQEHHMLAVKVDFEPSALDSIGPGKPKAMKKVERKIRQKTYFVYDVEKDQMIKEWVEKPEK